jgi:hypothetical protein
LFVPTVLTADEILFNRLTNRNDKLMHERAVNCGPQDERGQRPVSLEGTEIAKWEAVASHDATQSVVAEEVRDFVQYLQASEGIVS